MLLDTIIFLAVCGGFLLYLVVSVSKKKFERQEGAPRESSPIAYIIAGTILAIPAGTAWVVVCFGYFLPGVGLTEPNVLGTFKIQKPNKRGPYYDLRLQDTETSLLLSVAAFVFLLFALYLVFRGVYRLRNSPRS